MTPEVGGLIVAAVLAVLALNAYRDNLKSDASWERMRRDLTPVWTPPRPAYDPTRLILGMGTTCTSFGIIGADSGHTHSVVDTFR